MLRNWRSTFVDELGKVIEVLELKETVGSTFKADGAHRALADVRTASRTGSVAREDDDSIIELQVIIA